MGIGKLLTLLAALAATMLGAVPSAASGESGAPQEHELLAGLPERFRRTVEVVTYAAAPLRVTEADGSPMTSATLALMDESGSIAQTTATHAGGGRYVFTPLSRLKSRARTATTDTYTLLATAPGCVPTTTTLVVRETTAAVTADPEVVVRLRPGHPASLELAREDGGPLPESLEPLLSDAATLEAAWCSLGGWFGESRRLSLYPAVREASGRWIFHIPPGRQAVYVLIDHPGLLRHFVAGPFFVEDGVTTAVSVCLPKPYAIHARFRPADGIARPRYSQCHLSVSRSVVLPDGRPADVYARVAKVTTRALTLETVFDDLAPPTEQSEYWVSGGTDAHPAEGCDIPNAFMDGALPEFGNGTSASVEILYKPLDLSEARGDFTAVVKVSDSKGRLLAGAPYELVWQPRNYSEIILTSGTIPTSGVVEISGLRGGPEKEMSFAELQKAGWTPALLGLYVNDKEVGRIRFFDMDQYAGRIRPVHSDKRREFQFRLPLEKGDEAPDIELTDLADGRLFRLSDLRGQVVWLEFWATWCGPCQRPMHEMDALARSKAAEWRGKVALIGASVDETTEVVIRHLRQNNWVSAQQAWCHPEGDAQGRDSPQVRAFQVIGFPRAFLIDQEGKIVWTGHPGLGDLEKQIRDVLSAKR